MAEAEKKGLSQQAYKPLEEGQQYDPSSPTM